MAFLQLFASNSSFNLANFRNDEYDALLDQAACSADEISRREILLKAEQVLLDSGAVIPMSTALLHKTGALAHNSIACSKLTKHMLCCLCLDAETPLIHTKKL